MVLFHPLCLVVLFIVMALGLAAVRLIDSPQPVLHSLPLDACLATFNAMRALLLHNKGINETTEKDDHRVNYACVSIMTN